MGLIDDLPAGRIALDTAPFIYMMEEHPLFLDVVEPLFRAIDGARLRAVTSELTLLEVLVVPYRRGQAELAERYDALLTRGRGLHLVALDRSLLRAAAQLRATLGLRTPDALQIAAALASRCAAFVTNDRRLPAVPGLRVLQVADYAAPA